MQALGWARRRWAGRAGAGLGVQARKAQAERWGARQQAGRTGGQALGRASRHARTGAQGERHGRAREARRQLGGRRARGRARGARGRARQARGLGAGRAAWARRLARAMHSAWFLTRFFDSVVFLSP